MFLSVPIFQIFTVRKKKTYLFGVFVNFNCP